MSWPEAYQVKGKTHYRIRWWENGKKKSRTAGSLKSNLKAIRKQVERREVLDLPSPVSTVYCIEEYLEIIAKTLRPRTVEISRSSLETLKKPFAKTVIYDIKTPDLEQVKNKLLESRSVNGINIVIRHWKCFFAYCLRLGHVHENPAKMVKQFQKQNVARFLNRQELSTLYRASPKNLRRVIFVLYNTGFRKGEFLGISKKDIGPTWVDVMGKTGRRRVHLKAGVRKVLLKTCGIWTKNGLNSAFRRAVLQSKMGRIRIHDLRHTFASAYLKSGGTLADLRQNGGWESMEVLKDYTHFQESYLAERMVRVRL